MGDCIQFLLDAGENVSLVADRPLSDSEEITLSPFPQMIETLFSTKVIVLKGAGQNNLLSLF